MTYSVRYCSEELGIIQDSVRKVVSGVFKDKRELEYLNRCVAVCRPPITPMETKPYIDTTEDLPMITEEHYIPNWEQCYERAKYGDQI